MHTPTALDRLRADFHTRLDVATATALARALAQASNRTSADDFVTELRELSWAFPGSEPIAQYTATGLTNHIADVEPSEISCLVDEVRGIAAAHPHSYALTVILASALLAMSLGAGAHDAATGLAQLRLLADTFEDDDLLGEFYARGVFGRHATGEGRDAGARLAELRGIAWRFPDNVRIAHIWVTASLAAMIDGVAEHATLLDDIRMVADRHPQDPTLAQALGLAVGLHAEATSLR
jgi:hypothetical protein